MPRGARARGVASKDPPGGDPHGPRTVPINRYGVIGNFHTAVLIAPDGSIDWACLPRFAGPSVFGRLLDERRGGYQQVRPLGAASASARYIPATNVLETYFDLPEARRLRLVDFMPLAPGRESAAACLIVRWMEAEGGRVRVRSETDPRFEYGLRRAQWQLERSNAIGRSEGGEIWVGHPSRPELDGGMAVAEFAVEPGAPRAVEIAWGAARPTVAPPADLLRETMDFWRGWTHSDRAPFHRAAHRWHRWVVRSELMLKLLSRAETGAFVAAPTTSLPEWPGGPRNWDYRYVWIRDASFTAQALLMLGHIPEARRFLEWVSARRGELGRRAELRVLYGPHGERELGERTLPHLEGYLGSRPVRIGNLAERQFQLDIYGEVLDAAFRLFHLDPVAVEPLWPGLRLLTEWVEGRWRKPDRGIWEVRAPPAHYVHSKLMAWVAFDRAGRIARRFDGVRSAERWSEAADRVREDLLVRGYDRRQEAFVQAYERPGMDAANLRIPLVGFLPATDARMAGTIRRIEAELGPGPFLRRYLSADGIAGPEGSFLPCGFWLVECLARRGEKARAARYFSRLVRAAGPLELFSEEYDPVSGRALGNYPQALTHIGLLRAALALGTAYRGQPPFDPVMDR